MTECDESFSTVDTLFKKRKQISFKLQLQLLLAF